MGFEGCVGVHQMLKKGYGHLGRKTARARCGTVRGLGKSTQSVLARELAVQGAGEARAACVGLGMPSESIWTFLRSPSPVVPA